MTRSFLPGVGMRCCLEGALRRQAVDRQAEARVTPTRGEAGSAAEWRSEDLEVAVDVEVLDS